MNTTKFSLDKLAVMAELDSIYDYLRVLSNENNKFETRCIGSGHCCRIGLNLPMIECAFIAHHIYHKYMLILEGKGEEAANEYQNGVIDDLIKALYREKWTFNENYPDDEEHCAFYKNGCSIYEARPFICRAYGTISNVDDYCPRTRTDAGQVNYFRGKDVYNLILDFKDILKTWGKKFSQENYVVYMPVGVLRYLLPDDVMKMLAEKTNPECWKSVKAYRLALFQDLEAENRNL